MTLSTLSSKTSYTGNGATRAFPVPFPFLRAEDIKALLRQDGAEVPLLPGTHFEIAGAGQAEGGTLTLAEPPATGQTLVVYRDPAIVQEVDYVENAAFPAETHEAALDLLTMICQALDEKIGRAVLYPVSTPAEDIRDSSGFLAACEAARGQSQAPAASAAASLGPIQEAAAQAQEAAAAARQAVGGVRASATDAAPGSLSVKLAAGDGLTESLLSPGGDESLRLAVALAEDAGLEFSAGLLRAQLAQGGGLARTASGLGADLGTGGGQIPTNDILKQSMRPAMVAGRVLNHQTAGGM